MGQRIKYHRNTWQHLNSDLYVTSRLFFLIWYRWNMANIIHVLGANIPHHNHTILNFFQNELLDELPNAFHFYVVSRSDLSETFTLLDINSYPDEYLLTQEVIKIARKEPTAWFVLHGQFNASLWLAILLGLVPANRCVWHIWGADLYELSSSLKFRLFYPLRRLAQRKIARLWGTLGDLNHAYQQLKRKSSLDQRLYFPTRMPTNFPTKKCSYQRTILLGNSGDPSNQHLLGLKQIREIFGKNVRIVVPMGYPAGNSKYIAQVRQQAEQDFQQGQVDIITRKLEFEAYLELLSQCDLGYFPFERQQGIGTMCLLIQMNIPIAIHRANPFQQDLQAEGISFLFADEISNSEIIRVKSQLALLDKSKITFFPLSYKQEWLNCLHSLSLQAV
ncbi:TDP-N-acetylfucosamine:lipid II N-acetylfucosaminyltransferase [Glaesserella parasuis]|nr:TDP-N-acetylfucosamine:lipid II N-acetylfucosaminyltransferase [Glaesserella parasuis]MCT8662247.1 TDP-N-acetylfucosamine:lipid II N-acetylfucosaminyltransferase [Glaesserella parasuis]MCT8745254.1 TDP-N-acetylfucosamine:lipid II N-acetylfucosaminyltransferase [Glaesserella parasuis]MCT8747262.1 TDP-N-acetylfucosamine:lipid II N-acetylfucosaminyltransferase [Glaesserella parasuis]MCT8760157.1 TDP-N-acetylfucosamine:lipid II N-acetylfucosaminyltransferase [Glaesserella parasuis]